MSDVLVCQDCDHFIPAGQQVVLWHEGGEGSVAANFVCQKCGAKYPDITDEIKGQYLRRAI